MEVLEFNLDTLQQILPSWDEWLVFDNHPRIVERGIDFSEDVGTIKRHLFAEASRKGFDVTVKVLHGDRIMFQVFSPDGAYPKLPEGSDARKKHPWAQWLNGDEHVIPLERLSDVASLRAYIYKKAKAKGLKARVLVVADGLTVQAYKEKN